MENVWIFLIVIFVLAFTTFGLSLFLLFKEGDERYKIIKDKTATTTILFTLGSLTYSAGKEVFSIWKGNEITTQGVSSISTLAIISIVFCLSFLIYRKRYS